MKRSYKRLLTRLSVGSGLLLLGVTTSLMLLYWLATAPVPSYQRLLEQTDRQLASGELETSRQELESQLTALYSDAQVTSDWQTVLTQTQLNSWLATELPAALPELAEQGIQQPRLVLKAGQVTVAMQANLAGAETIVSVLCEPYVAEDSSLALEFGAARVGRVPFPLANILDRLRAAAGERSSSVRWVRSSGKVTLLIDIETLLSTSEQTRRLQAIEIRRGEIYVSGTTKPGEPRLAKKAPSVSR